MFTGLITEVGKIKKIIKRGDGLQIRIEAQKSSKELKLGDSIAINGVCQTAIKVGSNYFEIQSVEETLKKTTIGLFKEGEEVNIELAMKVADRFGGHIVQGHVDCVGTVKEIKKLTTSWLFKFRIPDEFIPMVTKIGSIALDGISLTIADVNKNIVITSIIPYTMENTILKNKKVNSYVNIEFDILGKYVINYLDFIFREQNKNKLSIERIKELGF